MALAIARIQQAKHEYVTNLVTAQKKINIIDEAASILIKTYKKDIPVVLAPEYFFSYSSSNIDRYIDNSLKTEVLRLLQKVSAKYPSVIFMPGTIAFKRDIDDKNRLVDKIRNVDGAIEIALTELKQDLAKHWPIEDSGKRIKTKLTSIINALDGIDKDVATWKDKKNKTGQQAGSQEITDKLNKYQSRRDKYIQFMKAYLGVYIACESGKVEKNLIMSTDLMDTVKWSGHNKLYVYQGGKRIYDIGKYSNYDENNNSCIVHIPHNNYEPAGSSFSNVMFEASGIKFGVEICLDHNVGILKGLDDKSLLPFKPDVQIVLSDSVKLVGKHFVASRLAHCSTSVNEEGVFTVATGNMGSKKVVESQWKRFNMADSNYTCIVSTLT